MRRYSYQRNKKSRKEKIGFFTAFSICIVAVGLALWSTYASIGGFGSANVTEPTYVATLTEDADSVDNPVTGITVTEPVTTTMPRPVPTQPKTLPATEVTDPSEFYTGENGSLQTILQVSASLDYPLESKMIIKEYSEEAVYNKTMQEYRAHTGIDIKADVGENILAMSEGVVEDVYEDNMYGTVIKITHGNFSILYCGIGGKIYCAEGEQIERGDIIAQVGEVPCEIADETHLHVEVHVGDKSIDPLTVISSDE